MKIQRLIEVIGDLGFIPKMLIVVFVLLGMILMNPKEDSLNDFDKWEEQDGSSGRRSHQSK